MTTLGGLDRRALTIAASGGPKYWSGSDAPVPGCITSERLFDAGAVFREAPEMHGVFEVVYLVERDLGLYRQWPLIIDEALRLLGTTGTLVLRYASSKNLATHQLMSLLHRRTAGRARVVLDQGWAGSPTRVIGISLEQEPRSHRLTGMSFALVTDGRQPARVASFAESVSAIRGIESLPHEVLVCGPPGSVDHLDGVLSDVRLVEQPTENVDRGWITRKKNLLIDGARYDVSVVAHDRYTMTPGLLEALTRFGADFDVLVPRQTTGRGFRYPDWVTVGDDVVLSPLEELDYTDYDPGVYVNGGIMIARTQLLRTVRWNELLFWAEAEDVELSRRLAAAGVVPRVAPEVEVRTLTTRADQIGVFGRRPVQSPLAPVHRPSGLAIGETVDLAAPEDGGLVRFGPGWETTVSGRTWSGHGAPEVVFSFATEVPAGRGFVLRLTVAEPADVDAVAVRALVNDVPLELRGVQLTPRGTTWTHALQAGMVRPGHTARLRLPSLTSGAILTELVLDEEEQQEQAVATWSFRMDDRDDCGYAAGWGGREDWGMWSLLEEVSLMARMAPLDAVTTISATVRAFLPRLDRPQLVTVLAGGVPVSTWIFDDEKESMRTFDVSASAFSGRWLPLSFRIARPTSPRQRALAPDDRLLGIGLTQLTSSLPFAARRATGSAAL